MELQKLVYFAEGWYLAIHTGESLIQERIEAWAYGPVIPSVYHEFKRFGNESILFEPDKHKFNFSPEVIDFLKEVYDGLKDYDAYQLSMLSHMEGGPWKKIYDESAGEIPRGARIEKEDIESYFRDNLIKE